MNLNLSIYADGDGGRQAVSSDGAPKAVGPYSQAVRAGGFIYCSGQLPVDPATGELVPGGVGEATERCLLNLAAILAAAGAGLADAVQVTVYLADMAQFASMNAAYAGFFPAEAGPPARATVGVASLPKGAPVEIALVALAPAAASAAGG